MEDCVQPTPCVNVPEPACVLHDYYLIDSSHLFGVSAEHEGVFHLEIHPSLQKKLNKQKLLQYFVMDTYLCYFG